MFSIQWQERVSNKKFLELSQSISIETMLSSKYPGWAGNQRIFFFLKESHGKISGKCMPLYMNLHGRTEVIISPVDSGVSHWGSGWGFVCMFLHWIFTPALEITRYFHSTLQKTEAQDDLSVHCIQEELSPMCKNQHSFLRAKCNPWVPNAVFGNAPAVASDDISSRVIAASESCR